MYTVADGMVMVLEFETVTLLVNHGVVVDVTVGVTV